MNNPELFNKHYQCTFITPTKEQIKSYELWLYYYYHAELYDQFICSRVDEHGIAIPSNYKENRLVNQNARELYNYIHLAKREWENENKTIILKEDWELSRRELMQLFTFKGLKEEYNRVFGETRNKI